MKKKQITTWVGVTLSVAVILLAFWFLHRQLAEISWPDVISYIRAIPTASLLASVFFAVCSYALLSCYDLIGLRYLGHDIPYRQSSLTSFMSFAIGHNVGIASLSGGSIRYRMYTLAGLSAADVARLIIFISITFAVGASGLLGVSLLLMPGSESAILQLPPGIRYLPGIVLVCVPVAYIGFTLVRKSPIRIGPWSVQPPKPRFAVAQVGIAITDISFAAATLYVLLLPIVQIDFFHFLGVYMLALGAGVVSNVPGGMGVFEAVLIAALPQIALPALLGTIIIYRLIYYLGPLCIALLLLVVHESRHHRQKIAKPVAVVSSWISSIAPQTMGAIVFLAGFILLVSGASPSVDARLSAISQIIPLPVLELSHLVGSVLGVGLLILARGLYRRLNGAYLITLVALASGAIVSLTKGLDYEEALILTAVGIVLFLSRAEFYRRESLANQQFSMQWILAIIFALGIATWIGFFSYRHVEYSQELWWRFAFDAQAPRMLRTLVFTAVTALAYALWKLFRANPLPAGTLESTFGALPDREAVHSVLDGALHSSGNLALLGDKRFLWASDQKAFIMYQVSGESWIAMGDPVGPENYHEELAWTFRELVDRHDGRTVFYQVSDEHLPLYVDLGLTLTKLGEEAIVDLGHFSLQGSQNAALRQILNKAKKNGAVFEIVPRTEIGPILPDLRRISDRWLEDKSAAEKGFSLGAFSESYITHFDCAVVRVDDSIVAFANLWLAPAGKELSIDLMRYDNQSPNGIMDYLFVELMQWGARNGYQSFNLGMAPLSGLERRPLAPLWHKIGHLIFTHGDNFYNFEGLRHYKSKFHPDWKPRYLACPGGWTQLPLALLDTSRLISGGLSGFLGKR